MKDSVSKIKLSANALFDKKAEQEDELLTLPLDVLYPFKHHPFKPYSDEKMAEMVESVKQNGIFVPIRVRPRKEGGGYEIVAGHNRVEAAAMAGLNEIPAIVREMDDDTAIIIMVDSNLRQRDKLLPSEKAKAYKMKMEALKRKAGRPQKNSAQLVPNLETRDIVAQEAGVNRMEVTRYVRLNELSEPLLEQVDSGALPFTPAVELSYLKPDEQTWLAYSMDSEETIPSLAQAKQLKQMSQEGRLTESAVEEILLTEKPAQNKVILNNDILKKYFPPGTTPKQMEQTIIKLLDEWQRSQQQSHPPPNLTVVRSETR